MRRRSLLLIGLLLGLMACAEMTKPGSEVDHFQTEDSPTSINTVDVQKDESVVQNADETKLAELCQKWLGSLPLQNRNGGLDRICHHMSRLQGCQSVEGAPIFHFEKRARREDPEKILTFALIHGDELPSGAVAHAWMSRLSEIEPRNDWRIIPILNPDGLKRRSRMNARGIDLNRNFPSEDWSENAQKAWREKTKSDPRRFPGDTAASEPETICAMNHIDDFNPDLIISIHTPYGVLDFDGPKMGFPKVNKLPWVSLGTFPGSLGRYMWTDRQRPVLTIELNHNLDEALDGFDRLQDISGQVALMLKKQKRQNVKTTASSIDDH